jgi:hypothetical protein
MNPNKKHLSRAGAFLCAAALCAVAFSVARNNGRIAEHDDALIRILTERFRLDADYARRFRRPDSAAPPFTGRFITTMKSWSFNKDTQTC